MKHEWNSVYISGLPKKSREEAMKVLLTNNIKEQQCKSCQVPHRQQSRRALLRRRHTKQAKETVDAARIQKGF